MFAKMREEMCIACCLYLMCLENLNHVKIIMQVASLSVFFLDGAASHGVLKDSWNSHVKFDYTVLCRNGCPMVSTVVIMFFRTLMVFEKMTRSTAGGCMVWPKSSAFTRSPANMNTMLAAASA